MMQIYDINDNLIYDAPLTEGCERVQELMAADHIQLSFKAVHSFTIPAGAYIDWFGIYRLLEPYTPTQQSEAEYLYTPQFHAEHITWKKYPFFFYTDEKAEPDWSLTGNATLFLDCVTMALQKTFGQSWHYSVASDLPASAYVAFQNTDIFSGLNAIAEAFKTEWYADLTENRIYLGHVSRDEQAVLEVGKNVNVPSVAANSDAYFNRFYAFGSTRNIPQNYVGANTQNVVNKRLTLDPAKYPDGYKDIKDLKSGEDFATNLFFDNIYPRATEGTEGSKGLAISNVRERRLFKVERGTTNKIPTGETDENGNPIYEMYSIWYFNIASLEFSKSMIIEGTDLTCSFESGALQGREFVLGYHEEDQKLETADGTPFYVYAGDYEILYVEENGITIPTTGVGLIPADGDEVALFNLELPDSYVEIAYKELEDALDEEMARRQKDYNSYTFKSNPVAFAENNPNLYLGRAVKFINSGKALDTRITKLTYKLDSESPLFPNEMTITIGEKRIKRSVATLKEEVVNANRNIDLLATLNKQTTTIQEAYKRTQDAILQGFNRIANMWQLDDDGNVYSKFNVYTLGWLSTKGISANEGGTGGTGIDIARMWEELASDDATKLINLSHMPSSVKIAVNWVSSVTGSDADSQINKWNEIVSFLSGISDTSSLSSILSGKANASAVEELSDDVSALSTHITNILARKVNAGTGLTGGGTLNADVTLSLATIGTAGTYTKVVVDAYGRVTGNSTLLESDIPALSISKITNLQSTINTINANFANYLPLTGEVMKNTNLVKNLNADLLDGYNADDLFKGRLNINSQISVSAEGWYTIASITTNGFNERGTIHFAIRTTGGDFRPYVTHYYINSSWAAGESNIFTNGIGGFITGIRLTQTGDSHAGGTRNIELCFSRDFTGYLIVLYSAYDNDGIINDNFTWNIGALPIADTSAEVWKTLDLWHGINTDKQIRTTNALYADSVVIGGVTLSWDYTNGMLKLDKGAYFLGPVSTKGVSNETGTGGTGVALSAVWDSLANNTDAHSSTKIHLDHIPTLTKSKISDFPTLVSAFANDAGYITASAIINKADKATTIQGYGLWEKYSDLNDAPMGAFFCGGNSVANSPESGNYISGITLAKDKNAQFRTQLGFVNNRIFTRQEYGANNWSQWRELAFLGDVAKKATTLAGYGITDAVPYLETSAEIKKVAIGYGYYDAGFASTGGFISAIHRGGNYGFQLNATNTGSDIWYRGLNNGTFTEWKRIAFIDGLVANATNADNAIWLIPNSGLAYGNSGLQYFNLNGTQGTITNENVTPNAGWYHIIRQNHANNLGFFSDIATPLNSAEIKYGLYWRAVSSGTNYGWYNLLDSNNYSNYAVTLNTNQTISGVKTLSADLLSATRGTLDIGDEYNSFNRIFAWHYKPNSLTKPILSSGKWYRIWNFSQGVAGTFQKNAIISINKAYNYEQGQTITLAVSINNWGQTYVINQLSGTTGLITKVRVTGKWNYSYVDVYISSAENAESYSVSGYGNGERVDFEELADDATNDSARTEELTVVNGTAVNYPLSLQNATPLVVNSTTMVANLNANYLGGLNKDSYQKAVYDYINVSGTADTTALPTVLAPCNYNGTSVIGAGNFNFYDTKFYNGQSNTSNRCQLAYGYDHDTIAFRRFSGGEWKSWKTVAFTDVDSLTPNSGQLSIIGAMQVNSAFRVLGEVDLSSMVRTNSTTGVLDLDGNYIDVYAPMNVKTSLTIGQATISWDSVNGMLKVNTGAYFTGPVSTKGVSGGSGLVAVAQFGITWHDAWAIDADSTYVESFGTTTKSISEGQSITNGSTITIVSDAFAGKKIGDIEIFTLGWENEAPANVRLAPYKISGNTLYCALLLSGTMSQATFKIKIY